MKNETQMYDDNAIDKVFETQTVSLIAQNLYQVLPVLYPHPKQHLVSWLNCSHKTVLSFS